MKIIDLVKYDVFELRIFYGYIVVLSSFLIVLIGWGTFFSFGVFFEPLLKEFGWTRAQTAGTYSLATLISGFMAIAMGKLNDRLGPKIVLTICGFFVGVGYLLMSLVSAIWQLYLFYGIFVAFGVGGFYVPPTSTVARWFVKRRASMNSVVLLGGSIGVMIIPSTATGLISTIGWRFTYIFMGLVNLIAIILLAQFLKRDPEQVGRLPYGANEETKNKIDLQDSGFSLREAIHVKQFWLLCGIFFCFFFCVNAVLAHIIIHAIGIGISPARAATIMIAFGGAGIVGRVAIGILGDRIGNKQMCLICFALISVDMLYIIIATDLVGLYAFSAIIGFSFAGLGALMPPLVADFFGLRSHGLIVGVVYASDMVGGTIGPIMAGRMFDVTGSYYLAFLFLAVIGFIGSILVLLLRPLETPQKIKYID
jgi:MFS family permease